MTANHRALDDADIALINKVRHTPALYDPRNPDFRLAYRKEQEWDTIAAFMGISASDARRRWTCLRDRYSRELKQMRLHPDKVEFGRNDFFKQMDFLRRYVKKRKERRSHIDKLGYCEDDVNNAKGNMKLHISGDEDTSTYIDEQESYDYKMQIASAEAVDYREYVEVDNNCTYEEEYIENQTADTSNSSFHMKSSEATNPLLLPQKSEIAYKINISPQRPQIVQQQNECFTEVINETEDDFFCKTVAKYLRQLSRRHKIKAKVEIFQILEKYIELEETSAPNSMQKS